MADLQPILNIPTHQLRKFFRFPLREAAARLHSTEGAVIHLCRRRGFTKWPYRQLTYLKRQMLSLRNAIAQVDGPTVMAADRLAQLKGQYKEIKYWTQGL
ncbi:hypothetical protein SPRG_09104 [Saprolegnia parasitica CBS 223.65]|uniref:RWP-RK domain-containing protein n=1 Tax=Saprolegnia parasitica (strain CBS 223.65) TaxID=695850 RepID=A0A067C801_SAPPC|nr:hypothetical protein SPRG_09104 [Saprolegnia parasitica CBS 223.65]KDO25275.1 hypothetical protein SPRG_09104 [Saprolegnia parasitica CBS 223.65]|eukprot:XP_012203935.1 hypothetical protein SPRG_09104 [Saprolegnia parasitica CBS 223.65]